MGGRRLFSFLQNAKARLSRQAVFPPAAGRTFPAWGLAVRLCPLAAGSFGMGVSPAIPPAGYIKAWAVERRILRHGGRAFSRSGASCPPGGFARRGARWSLAHPAASGVSRPCPGQAMAQFRSGLLPSGVHPPAVAGGAAGSGTPLPPASSPRPTPRQADPPAAAG